LNQSLLINNELELCAVKADISKLPGAYGSSMAQKQRPRRLRFVHCRQPGNYKTVNIKIVNN
jgi:hypothetical protein